MKYWIERWSQLRKKELISYPKEFPIHEAYKVGMRNLIDLMNGSPCKNGDFSPRISCSAEKTVLPGCICLKTV